MGDGAADKCLSLTNIHKGCTNLRNVSRLGDGSWEVGDKERKVIFSQKKCSNPLNVLSKAKCQYSRLKRQSK